jgi:DNA polymerase gamma 1
MKTTELGYPVLSDEVHLKVFGKGDRESLTPKKFSAVVRNLKAHGLSAPIEDPGSHYDGDLPLPALLGPNLKDHFEKIAEKQIGSYVEKAEELAQVAILPLPPSEIISYEAGWTRYSFDGEVWQVEKVEKPLEEAFCFDTETYVNGGNFPIIGTALSEKAYYVWLASELLNPELPENHWDQFRMIPVGRDRFICGHNISFDRIRSQEAYTLFGNGPENFWFDTLSAHVGVSGLAAGQRWIHAIAGKDFELLNDKEKAILRRKPRWFFRGSTNSLVACYNYHVASAGGFFGDSEPLDEGDKAVREVFVKATSMAEINAQLFECVDYAIKDARYTLELFQAIWPKYRNSTPSLVGLCGHYHLAGSIVPLVDNWNEWIQNVERVYEEHISEMTESCKGMMWTLLEDWKEGDEEKRLEIQSDPWYSQLDWEVKMQKGKYAGIPNWARPFIKDPDQEIGVRSRLAHLLMKLEWEKSPIKWVPGDGWCYYDGELNLQKIPHPKKPGENVGGLFSKEFVKDMDNGVLSSSLPAASRALEIANAISYWTSVRGRVMSRIPMRVENPYGKDCQVTLPEILPHGTYTRRTVENLMITMTSTKSWRIGTELKTRVSAPEGWKVVGADFDGQEMNIAAIYADKWEGGVIGCSPLGNRILCGSKELGTDPHTSLAREINPSAYESVLWDPELGPCEEVSIL